MGDVMGSSDLQGFDQRLRRIDRRHRQLARGYVTTVNQDGLVVAEPRGRARSFPWRGLMFTLVAFLAVKAFLFAQIGAQDYNSTVATLQTGTTIEQLGAWVMTADPITIRLSGFIPVLP